jgi:hypothetical protein
MALRLVLGIGLLASLLASGCTQPGSNAPNAPPMSVDQAQALVEAAPAKLPDQYGLVMTVTSGSRTLLTVNGTLDNATRTSYLEMRGDADALGGPSAARSSQARAYLASGVEIYSTPSGSLYLANGTAFTFARGERMGGVVPPPDQGPFASFLDPAHAFAGHNVTVTSVTPTTYKGQPAARIAATTNASGQVVNATFVVYTASGRLAHVDTTIPSSNASSATDPLAGDAVSVDILYDTEASALVPTAVTRALGLSYTSDRQPFGSARGPVTWTFRVSGGVPASDVEAQVKSAAPAAYGSGSDPSKAPTLWSLRLSDGSRTEDNVTITFHDNDRDGKVSANDTLVIDAANGTAAPAVVLLDSATGTYVVPDAGVAAALAAGVVVALAARKRR